MTNEEKYGNIESIHVKWVLFSLKEGSSIMLIDIASYITLILIAFLCWHWRVKKSEKVWEEPFYFIMCTMVSVPYTLYLLDKYNLPTAMGWVNDNINTQNWFSLIGNCLGVFVSAVLGGIFLFVATRIQIDHEDEKLVLKRKKKQ